MPAEHARRTVRLADLLRRTGLGDAGAFADLYDETSTLVYGMALSIMTSTSLASEVMQKIYAEVWQQAPRQNPNQHPLAWVLSIAHRQLVEQVRSLGKDSAPERHAVLNGESEFGHLRHEGGSRSNAGRTRTTWGSLSPLYRDAVALAYFGGFSQTEVARILGLPLGTVKARIRDGLTALRTAMGGAL